MRTLLSMAVLGALAIVGGTFAAGTLAGGSGEAMPAGALVKANGAPPKDHAVQRVDDGTWRLGSFKNTAGATCLEHEVPLEGVATGCLDLDRLFAERGDLIAMPGARQISSNTRKLSWDNAWVYGFVTARVASIELVRFDCTTKEVAIDDAGAFMYVASRAELARGSGPYKLLALDAKGDVLAEAPANVGLPANARKAGIDPPRPEASCA
jgi:hypothetical protein